MSQIRVVVFDDEVDLAAEWASRISDASDETQIVDAGENDFGSLLKIINGRRSRWRNIDQDSNYGDWHPVDSADVVVVDYDLLAYSGSLDTTGNRLAYLLRCFTTCGVIVLLNEFGRNTFNLDLANQPRDFADIHLGDEQIGNPGLWGFSCAGYRPWHWPAIPNAVANFNACVKEVEQNLSEPILDFLNLRQVVDWIPRLGWEFLDGPYDAEEVTFEQLAVANLAPKDQVPDEQIARIAAARIVSFVNYVIMPQQNILVDAPHLIARAPSLLVCGQDDIQIWNQLANRHESELQNLINRKLDGFQFAKSHWMPKTAWTWPHIAKDYSIDEIRDPWSYRPPDWLFCEDISQFVPSGLAREYRANVSPPYTKRYVFDINADGADDYLEQLGVYGPTDPRLVQYSPEMLFSL